MAERGRLKRARGWLARRRASVAAARRGGAGPPSGRSGAGSAAGDGTPERAAAVAAPETPPPPDRRSARASVSDDATTVDDDRSERSAREGASALAGSAAAGLRRGGSRARRAWLGIPLAIRQRLAAGSALAAIVAVVVFVLVPLAPCWAPAGDRCPPDDDAIALVPAEAGAYLHANLDPDTDQAEDAAAIAERLPTLTEIAVSALPGLPLDAISFDRDVRPWSGGEIAVVLVPLGDGIEPVLMLEVGEDGADAAVEFGASLLGPEAEDVEIEGTAAKLDDDGIAAALAGGFLVVGEEGLVSESIALAGGEGESLAEDEDAEAARERLPEERLADAYLAPPLLRRLSDQGDLGAFDAFVEPTASEGVALSLGVEADRLAVAVRSRLDPEAAAASSELFSALEPFEPSLASEISADALAYLGVGDPAASASTLIARAAETSPRLFAGLERLERRLRRRDGIDVERRLLPLLAGEAALTVEPQLAPGEEGDGTSPATPYLGLLATGVDEDAAAELAELQVPIARAVDPGSGQTPVFETGEIAGVEVQSLRISPVVDLSYGTFDEQLVVATSPVAIERARSGESSLADADAFGELTEGLPELSSLFLYLDFEGLLDLGEALFLAEDPDYARLAPDLRTLTAAVLSVRRGESELDTDLRVGVGEADPLTTGAGEAE